MSTLDCTIGRAVRWVIENAQLAALRIVALSLALGGGFCVAAPGPTSALDAPNVVAISPRFVTSGQPTAQALKELKAQGFEAVIYLVPPGASDAIPDEAQIVERQGMTFIQVPIPFDDPTTAHFERFAAAMNSLGARRVLVHCQINLRASSMAFLYRVITLKEDPRVAYESVVGVWTPSGKWRRLIEAELRQHHVEFELY